MPIEVNPERDDLINMLSEKLGIDPKTILIRTEDGMVTRERAALVFDVDFEDVTDETLNSFDSSRESHDIDRTMSAAFHFLITIGIIDEDLKPICEIPLLDYCLKRYGRHSVAWYCAKIASVALHLDWYKGKVEEGELPVVKAIYQAEQLGAWCVEMNLKFEHEENALRGAKSVESGKIGAEITHAVTRPKTQPRLEKMKMLVPEFGVDTAASILEAEGMGKFEANKKLWHRWLERQTK